MAEETQTLEQTLENTGLGHFVNTNKDSILIAMGIALAAIIGISIYQNNLVKNEKMLQDKIYQFSETNVAPYIDVKEGQTAISEDEVVKAFVEADSELLKNANFLPMLFDVTKKMEESKSAQKLIPVFEKVIANYKPNEYGFLFLSLKLAVIYENNNDFEKAIKTLEGLLSANHDLVKSKVYLDLGRLYKKSGSKDKAKANFQYIIDNAKDADYVKLAELYLLQL